MPVYVYKAKKGPNEIVQGEIEMGSQDAVVSRLEEMGLVPVSVIQKQDTVRGPGPRVQGSEKQKLPFELIKVKTQDIDTFTRQLASLTKTSVPILQALSLICEQTESRIFRDVVDGLKKQIKDGQMLSGAMERYPRIFNNLYLNMIKSGEKSGSLYEILYRLAEHREKEQETRQKIVAAMAYPVFMIIVGIATVFIMLTFFLPKLTGLFENMKQTLPLPTKILIGISNFMSGNWYWFLFALVLVIAIFGRVKPGSKKKFLFDMVKLYIPFMKKLIKNAEIAKFSRTLCMLLKNGLSIYESLKLATDGLDNDALKESLERVGDEIVGQGSTLSSSLKKINIFPKFAVNMIAVGEEGGRLEESLTEIAVVYEREAEQAMKIITSLLEPLLILTVGTVVGFIVFAMLLPIFNIGVTAQ